MEKVKLIVKNNPKSPIAEAYRTLRTNLQFAGVGAEVKTIEITSTAPGEGKSTVLCNLGLALASTGKRIIVLGCDMRLPTIYKKLKLSNMIGITNVLSGKNSFEECLQQVDIEGKTLDVLTSGPCPPNPSEILGSVKMQKLMVELKEKYDYVLIDTPPVGMVTDAAVLSSYTDGVLLVVESGRHNPQAVQHAKALLENVHANVLGCVLNKVDVKKDKKYGYGYGYYASNE